jgi:hypothetical protein
MQTNAFPKGFKPQRIGIPQAKAIADLPPSAIFQYFRENPDIARRLLAESYNKRFTPSTFIQQKGAIFSVGWFSRAARYECVQEFATLADAATDYLLLSLGKQRWIPPETVPRPEPER